MILPSRRFLLFLLVPAALLVLWPSRTAATLVLTYDVVLVLLALLDLAVSPRPGQIAVTRQVPRLLSLGADNAIGWEVHNRSNVPVSLRLTDDVDEDLIRDRVEVEAGIKARARAELRYQVRPVRRGVHELGDIHIRYPTRLGLVLRQRRIAARTSVKVYPNVTSLARYDLAVRHRRLTEMGMIAAKQRGRGSMFESLRDYVPGDQWTDIAWKATARRGRLTTRNYEDDRSQNVLLLIDCGRLMATRVDDLSRLDHAINAAILLTYVTIRQGDYIGMVAFHDDIAAYVPPIKGRGALSRMNEALYNLEPRLCEPDYAGACQFLAMRHRKRSLVIILTDVLDRNSSSALLGYAARFARQHLSLCFTMRNLEMEELAARPPVESLDCSSKAVAIEVLERRTQAMAHMRRLGVDVLDVDPRQLTPRLIDRYLWYKHRQGL